ncbi:MAG: hypothetical protein M1389_12740 [Chloroflexi bacterium]|nr:hypothetical protein [Chloroflexota bacterium]MCL5025992.1 hypothetical protein [Chloroflexota bacterium]
MPLITEIAPFIKPRAADSSQSEYQAASLPYDENWGWLPLLCVVDALGLLLLAIADTGARQGASFAVPLFWVGLLLLFVPTAARLSWRTASRRERIGLVVVLGLALHFVKILHSPVNFTFVDEFQHWRTAEDILRSGHLFQPNPVLPVSSLFPGLEILTTALISLTGLPIFVAGNIVVVTARLVLVLALYLFYEEITLSPRVAGIAVLVYTANPNFVFFDAVFAYESLALPLAALALFATVRRAHTYGGDRVGVSILVLFAVLAVVVSHHLTSYALLAFLVLWTLQPQVLGLLSVVTRWLGGRTSPSSHTGAAATTPSLERTASSFRRRGRQSVPADIALFSVLATVVWSAYVASPAVSYLASSLMAGINELMQLVSGEITARQLFRSYGGEMPPFWEPVAAYASVMMVLALLPVGLLQLRSQHAANVVATALATAALLYPAVLPLRLTPRGIDASGRALPFLFAAIALVVAVGVTDNELPRLPDLKKSARFALVAGVIFVGGVVIGWPFWSRLPGPFLVASHTRSVGQEGLAAAEWARTYLGPDNRIATDFINQLLMGSYGAQHPLVPSASGEMISPIFFSSQFGAAELALLQRAAIRYVLIDRRLGSGLPMTGFYFDAEEPEAFHHTTPIPLSTLGKFDSTDNVSRILDTGDIEIYDVERLLHAP